MNTVHSKTMLVIFAIIAVYYIVDYALIELNFGPPEFRVRIVNSRPKRQNSLPLRHYAVLTHYGLIRDQTGPWPPAIGSKAIIITTEGSALYTCDAMLSSPNILLITSMKKPNFLEAFFPWVHNWKEDNITLSVSGCRDKVCPKPEINEYFLVTSLGRHQKASKTDVKDSVDWKPGDPPYNSTNESLPQECEKLIIENATMNKDVLLSSKAWF
ncbi:MAG: hypothetical protein WC612_05320 [Bdellovibrionales bacterium]|jgi:hypothetical protein